MQSLGLSASERRAFEETLRSSHTRRITVYVTDLSGSILSSLTPVLLDGQVVVDADAEVTRAASLTFLDPAHALSFDTDSPDDGALYADRMLRIDYGVRVPALERTVTVTVFHGPVTKLDRAGDVVSVEAQGKEALARGAIWRTMVVKKGFPTVSAIKMLLRDRAGERNFAFASLSHRVPSTRSLDRYSEIWASALSLARSAHRQLFYNGAGVLVLRSYPSSPVYTFRDGTGGDIVGGVQVSYQMDDVRNTVVVEGGIPKGSKTRVRWAEPAPSSHALSPYRLARNGDPRYLVEVVKEDSIRSKSAAKKRAKDLLARRLLEPVEVTFDSLPIPHLDPLDTVRVESEALTTTFALRRFTIPLGESGSPVMPVGYLKRTSIIRKRFR